MSCLGNWCRAPWLTWTQSASQLVSDSGIAAEPLKLWAQLLLVLLRGIPEPIKPNAGPSPGTAGRNFRNWTANRIA